MPPDYPAMRAERPADGPSEPPGQPPHEQKAWPSDVETLAHGDTPRDRTGTPPLCVDLDGTLVKSDTLVDSVLAIARQKPGLLLKIPGWLGEGKAAFKQHVADSVTLEVATLPYNAALLEYLFAEHEAGRALYLATAADRSLADRIAAHLSIFTGVLASDGHLNLAGENKLKAFEQQFGERFAYIGNATPDLPILRRCVEPAVANPTPGLLAGMRTAGISPARSFNDRVSPLKSWVRAIRLHQWAKNTLVFLPLLLAHVWTAAHLTAAIIAFSAFGLCASATYIVNDLLDIEADRRHHRKRRRPFAAGDLSALAGCVVVALFLVLAAALALALPHLVARVGTPMAQPSSFARWLLLYGVTTSAYSLRLKRLVLLDVFVLSGLYTVRILAGAAATGVDVSAWLASFSIFFFLSLAFVKRFAELESLRRRDAVPSNGRGYELTDIEQLRSFGTAAAYASVVVLTLYISNLKGELYHHSGRLWLLVPVLLLWVSRLWLLASRGLLNEDPVVYAITDKRSLAMGLVVVALVASAL